MLPDMLGAALTYASYGWPVFPCRPGGKVPLGGLVPHGCLDASTDRDVIAGWWTRAPSANVAIATGSPGPDVVDFDTKKGAPGAETFQRLRAAGLLNGAFQVVDTPSGGWHLYFAGTRQGNGSLNRFGVDFRGAGGYVVAPPSFIAADDLDGYTLTDHRDPTGRTVSWSAIVDNLAPRTVSYADRPRRDGNHGALIDWLSRQQEPGRNNALFWAANRALETGAGRDVLEALISTATSIGLGEREARLTVNSAARRAGRSAA